MSKKRKEFIRNESVDIRTKLKILKEYQEQIGEPIKVKTTYKGYNIGIWQNNLRYKYLHGKLNLQEELEEEFVKIGVLGERKRAPKTTDNEKLNMILEFEENREDSIIRTKTIDNKGNKIGKYRSELQKKINKNSSKLTKKEIKLLKGKGIIYYTKDEVKEISNRYSIPTSVVLAMTQKYQNIEDSKYAYKIGELSPNTTFLNKRGIIISSRQMSIRQKQKYLKLITAIFGDEVLSDITKYVNEADIESALQNLPERYRTVILERYNPQDDKAKIFSDIGEKLGISGTRVKQIHNQSLEKMKKTISIYSIDEQLEERNSLQEDLNRLENMTYKEWESEKLNYDIRSLKISKLSAKKLNENGFETVSDLTRVKQSELLKIKGFGKIMVSTILEEVEKRKINLSEEQKEGEKTLLEEKIKGLSKKINSYYNAYNYYIDEESIFDKEGTIPPSIIENTQSTLNEKKKEKKQKQITLNQLDEDIAEQKDKLERNLNKEII